MKPNTNPLVWVDLEMTGLNPDKDHIIEMAAVITHPTLEVIAESPVFVIHQPERVLNAMDEWNTTQHSKSGLLARVKNSCLTYEEAETHMLAFLMSHVLPRKSPLCGSSICHDRRFLHRWMPKLEQYFHYRNLDVSTLRILAYQWAPRRVPIRKKISQHLALQDIYDAISELKHYKKHFLKT